MKKLMAVLGAITLMAVGGAFFLIKNESTEKTDNSDKVSESNSVSASKPQKEISELKSSKPEYVIKEYKGNIAVFEGSEKLPFRTTCIMVSELPEADRSLLKKGIVASSREEMDTILEDYCS